MPKSPTPAKTTRRRSDAAERILREAMRLFAERGYERTSIPDIQTAAGLAPGSGAMYKHYPSKEAVLRTGMERFARQSRKAGSGLQQLDAPALNALGALVRDALALLGEERDEIRVAWRELEPFPDLQAQVRADVMQASYRALARWLDAKVQAGELRPHDSEAMAAVLLGSVSMFRVYEALWGERAVPVDDERFARAVHELILHGLAPTDSSPARGEPRPRRRRARRRE